MQVEFLQRSSALHAKEAAQKEKARIERESSSDEEVSRVQARKVEELLIKADSDARAKVRLYSHRSKMAAGKLLFHVG